MTFNLRLTLFLTSCVILLATYVEANRAGGPKLKFCDYIMQIGIHNPHCPPNGMGRSIKMRDQEAEPENKDNTDAVTTDGETTKTTVSTREFHPHRSKFCESNLLCVDVVGNPCCVAQGVCPTKQQLDVKCVRNKPTNWCNADYDCGRGSLCCDTGCGYNICVSAQ
ncbi:hypothetical protein M3Y97_00131900 [Aphelenchoides bicaudatus]|nr:hypothetical protein M3Y97_00131900 [Aphelenchoides bicaudatus]